MICSLLLIIRISFHAGNRYGAFCQYECLRTVPPFDSTITQYSDTAYRLFAVSGILYRVCYCLRWDIVLSGTAGQEASGVRPSLFHRCYRLNLNDHTVVKLSHLHGTSCRRVFRKEFLVGFIEPAELVNIRHKHQGLEHMFQV